MPTQIYVNLPVQDLQKSKAFFTKLGYTFNTDFTDDKGACMIVSDSIFIMLLVQDFFKTFTDKPVADPKQITGSIICLSSESRTKVDEIIRQAKAAGASVPRNSEDHGFMYQWGYEDLDGHLWEYAYIEPLA